jgi:hypothetical protein
LNEWVALPIGLETNRSAQGFHLGEIVYPKLIAYAQQQTPVRLGHERSSHYSMNLLANVVAQGPRTSDLLESLFAESCPKLRLKLIAETIDSRSSELSFSDRSLNGSFRSRQVL